MSNLSPFIKTISLGKELSEDAMTEAMRFIMNGEATDNEIEEFLVKLSERGEAVSEITGAAKVMRNMAASIKAPEGSIDCCGTGGDASETYNISTAVAFVCAASGVPIAKHGNRAASSKSGAADVLEQLGISLDLNKDNLELALKELNFCFLMAPHHHGAMRHVMPARKRIAHRTIFNLLGPLANPAGTKKQLIGVFDEKWLRPMAETLRNLGSETAWLVHGTDGLDEITTTAETKCVVLENRSIEERTLIPEDFGLERASPELLKGGDAEQNAAAIYALLEGHKNAYRDIVLANTAAVLMIHGKTNDLKEGMKLAAYEIDSGKALSIFERYKAFSQEHKEL
ncbi:MAG: anthranilate phosphoribosyltransferase [Pseudomonadota bacterium]